MASSCRWVLCLPQPLPNAHSSHLSASESAAHLLLEAFWEKFLCFSSERARIRTERSNWLQSWVSKSQRLMQRRAWLLCGVKGNYPKPGLLPLLQVQRCLKRKKQSIWIWIGENNKCRRDRAWIARHCVPTAAIAKGGVAIRDSLNILLPEEASRHPGTVQH